MLPSTTTNDSENLRFTLRDLFIVTTVAAVFFALVRALGIFGAPLAFLAALSFTNWIYPRLRKYAFERQEWMFDLIWGSVMPLVCLAFAATIDGPPDVVSDPGVLLLIAPIALHVIVFTLWLTFEKSLEPVAALFSGILAVGFFIALISGLLLAPWALFVTLLEGIGLIAFTPLFTAYACWRQMEQAAAVARFQRAQGWRTAAGVIMAIAVPLLVGVLAVIAIRALL